MAGPKLTTIKVSLNEFRRLQQIETVAKRVAQSWGEDDFDDQILALKLAFLPPAGAITQRAPSDTIEPHEPA